MKNKKLISVFFTAAFVLSFLTGCIHNLNDDDKVYYVKGSLYYEDGRGNLLSELNTRAAFPKIETSDFQVQLTARCTSATKPDVKTTFRADENFSIAITAGTWSISGISWKTDAGSAENPQFKSFANVTVTVSLDEPNPIIPPIKMVPYSTSAESGKGDFNLKFKVECTDEINYLRVTWIENDNNQYNWNSDILNNADQNFGLDEYAAGIYDMTFSFYKKTGTGNDAKYDLKYSFMETVTVLEGISTEVWYSPDSEYMAVDAKGNQYVKITQELVNKFRQQTFFVDPVEGNDENNGTINKPFKTFYKAYLTWQNSFENAKAASFGIYIKSSPESPYSEHIKDEYWYEFSGKLTIASYKDVPGDNRGLFELTQEFDGDGCEAKIQLLNTTGVSTKLYINGIRFNAQNLGLSEQFVKNDGVDSSFSNCEFINCTSGAIYNDNGKLTLDHCKITDNANISGKCAGIYNFNGKLTMNACTVSTNKINQQWEDVAAGLYNLGGDVIIAGGVFEGNYNNYGKYGAICNKFSNPYEPCNLEINGTVFNDNSLGRPIDVSFTKASNIFNDTNCELKLSNVTFSGIQDDELNDYYFVNSQGPLSLYNVKANSSNASIYAGSTLNLSGKIELDDIKAIKLKNGSFVTLADNISLATGKTLAANIELSVEAAAGVKVFHAETEKIIQENMLKFALLNADGYGIQVAKASGAGAEGKLILAYYVSGTDHQLLPAGNDTTGDGSMNKPFARVGKAVSSIQGNPASFLILIDGTTSENSAIEIPCSMTLQGLTSDKTKNVIKRTSSVLGTASFIVAANKNLHLRDVTVDGQGITTNSKGAGILSTSTSSGNYSLVMNNAAVINCKTTNTTGGGGIYVSQVSLSMDEKSVVKNNFAESGNGGGIYIYSTGSVSMTLMGEIDSNFAKNGGGIYVPSSSNTLTLTLDKIKISGNTANGNSDETGNGGGIYYAAGSNSKLYLKSGVIGDASATTQASADPEEAIYNYSNYAGQNGGGLYSSGHVQMATDGGSDEFVIAYNYAQSSGGGIYSAAQSTFYVNAFTEYKNNYAPENCGSGVYFAGSSLIMDTTRKTVFADTDILKLSAKGKQLSLTTGTISTSHINLESYNPTDLDDNKSALVVFGATNYTNAKYLKSYKSEEGYYISTSGFLKKLDPATEARLVDLDWNNPDDPNKAKVLLIDHQQEINTIRNKISIIEHLAGYSFKLNTDLDYGGNAEWTPIGASSGSYFAGTFDGGNHVIKGYIIDLNVMTNISEKKAFGLFGYTDGATIKNFNINGDIKVKTASGTAMYYGGIVGHAKNTLIENCTSTIRTQDTASSISGSYVGGIAGRIEGGIIKDCTYRDSLYGDYVGGIVSYSLNSNISSCKTTSYASVNGQRGGGGIVWSFKGEDCDLHDCSNEATINDLSNNNNIDYEAGIVGKFEGREVYNCWNAGNINFNVNGARDAGNICIGGIVGSLVSVRGTVNNCANRGKINHNNHEVTRDLPAGLQIYVGGIIGLVEPDDVTVSACYNNSAINIYSERDADASKFHSADIIGSILDAKTSKKHINLKYCIILSDLGEDVYDDKNWLTIPDVPSTNLISQGYLFKSDSETYENLAQAIPDTLNNWASNHTPSNAEESYKSWKWENFTSSFFEN